MSGQAIFGLAMLIPVAVFVFGCIYLWLQATKTFWRSERGATVIGVLYIAAAIQAFMLAGRLSSLPYAFSGVGLGVCACIWLVKIADIRRQKEEMDGHRRDATNDQSGTTSGTKSYDFTGSSASTLVAAGGLAAPVSVAVVNAISIANVTADEDVEPSEPDIDTLEVFTKPFAGYRSWSIENMQQPLLTGAFSYTWKPGKNHAVCGGSGCRCDICSATEVFDMQHQAPGVDCRCGFNAYSSIDMVSGPAQPETIIGGIVGWGKLVEGTRGWRSEFACIAAIYAPKLNIFLDDIVNTGYAPIMGSCLDNLPPTRAEYLADHYGVPKCRTIEEVVEETERLAEWMAGEDLR